MDRTALCWRVEEACLNAWPALRQVHFGGWVLRFSGGFTRRANSANALGGERLGGNPLFAGVETLYRHNRQPTIWRLTTLVGDDTDRGLADRGYRNEGLSLVLYRDCATAPAAADPAVRLAARPSRTWLAAMARLQSYDKSAAALYRRIVGALSVPAAFAELRDDPGEGPVALAVAAVHRGVACYQSVVTDPNRRRRGYAHRVMTRLAAWAAAQGAAAACLEVEAANEPAVALYARLGFCELYRYHYRRQPP